MNRNEKRRLNARERELMHRILERPFPGRDQLLRQIEEATVHWIDTGGSPALVFEVPASTERAPVEQRTPLEASYVAADVDGGTIHLVLHVLNGQLAELEVFRSDGEAVMVFPDAANVRPAY